MERSADSYLHKKFKKQLNLEPNLQNADKEERTTVASVRNSELWQNYQNSDSVTDQITVITGQLHKSSDYIPGKNINDSVPKSSTNYENTFNATVLESSNVAKSSISHLSVVNVAEKGESSADVSERSKQPGGESVDLQSSNSCISYVISKSSRVENQSQPESHFRAANFDTRFNVSEPIAIPTADTSSILDNVYSKQYVTSKLVNVDKVGDISSNVSVGNNDHTFNQEDSCSLTDIRSAESRLENHTQEFGSTEKSSGGKYICSYCNLACSKPSVLQKHIRAHTNERPYPCVSCGFSFKTRSNLYKHCRSRTHANRVMGNKAQEIHNEADTDSQSKMEYIDQSNSVESGGEDVVVVSRTKDPPSDANGQNIERLEHEIKTKPYKPRFHTAKVFFDSISKENQKDAEDQKVPETVQNRPSNSDLLSLHINEVINKNNAIVNSNESYLFRKRSIDNNHIDNVNSNEVHHRLNEGTYSQISEERHSDEPLNLTNKPRKRCLSEVAEPAMHTSLIKELLLKNLYAESMQCPHCKMIFQTVTELELHKMRSCKGFTKSGARYSRSSSVNVASILTKNKNAFDNIPHLQNTVFPLKSPGPFLGKTRLVDTDKCKSFSFDDGLPNFQSSLQNPSDILKTSLRYSLSPLTIQNDKVKKPPIKLFGGEVKITHTTGETKSFKIDSKDCEKYGGDNFTDYGGRLSENRVVKSSLQSGGTVLQNKPNYNAKQESLRSSPDVIRVYESTTLSPSIDIASLEKTKFNFDRQQQGQDLDNEYKSNSELLVRPPADAIGSSNFNSTANASYKYTNIMDFSQKAVKLLAPNLKQPNLTIPGVPIPTMSTKIALPRAPSVAVELKQDPPKVFEPSPNSRTQTENDRVNVINLPSASKSHETEVRHLENIQFAQKQILLHQKMSAEPLSPRVQSPKVNPVNLLVNGKVVRYVPGIPGPVAADVPLNVAYGNNASRIVSTNFRPQKRISLSETVKSPLAVETSALAQSPVDRTPENRVPLHGSQLQIERKYSEHERPSKSPKFGTLEVKTNESMAPRTTTEMKSPSVKSIEIKSSKNETKSLSHSAIPSSNMSEVPKKFARPNTLALKPSLALNKQHHGLTPTMFNQILISPDTPRVAKKYMQHFLHGNYFSYLGLKSSTKSVYCTLNKTQPFYVPHFKKLSMYSEWRQQDTKTDKLYVSAYDSRQGQPKYTTAGKTAVDFVVHSSYKFIVTEASALRSDEQNKSNSILGGYESNEDYTYVRGRGRGRYVCDQCGIRCKKPSMLKKHIRTHTNDRPFTCNHCNFSFKTKGNLTKHMKSKAHTKNYAASSSSSSSAQQSGTQSSESDTDDSGMDSSDESTRQQEHEAAYGLLSLSQKTTQNVTSNSPTSNYATSPSPVCSLGINPVESSFMNTEQVTQVNNSNFAKNKILDQQVTINFNASKLLNEIPATTAESSASSKEMQNLIQFLGKSNANRPLTYPYTSDVVEDLEEVENDDVSANPANIGAGASNHEGTSQMENKVEQRNITTFSIVQKHNVHYSPSEAFSSKVAENRRITIPITISYDPNYLDHYKSQEDASAVSILTTNASRSVTPVVKINDRVVLNNVPYNSIISDTRKRKVSEVEIGSANAKLHRMNSELEAMDLSMPSLVEKSVSPEVNIVRYNGASPTKENESRISNLHAVEARSNPHADTVVRNTSRSMEYKNIEKSNFGDSSNVLVTDRLKLSYKLSNDENYKHNGASYDTAEVAFTRESESVINLKTQNQTEADQININYVIQENHPIITTFTEVPSSFSPLDYDNSAMETLAEVATKQVKLEKNTLAKSVASEYLKLATKHEFQANDGIRESNNFVSSTKEVNELIVKPEENKSCTICSKNFSKPSQLRLHMNIHYLERPFRCDPCSVSFRTKGHLQKHERSASHHNKLSSSPLLSSSEPRPFKCSDCNIAFRIHGHLAKHLRSKMHIMKLECLAKIPFGLYAELERANSLLTEINTTDGDQCLESLKALARKVFMNDPSKLNQLEVSLNSTDTSDS